MSQIFRDSFPNQGQAIRCLMTAMIGGSLLALSGLILTGTMTVLILAFPIMILLSPILIPAVAALSMVNTGFMFSGGLLAATLAVIAWLYHSVTGKHPLWAEHMSYLKMKVGGKAGDVESDGGNGHNTKEESVHKES